MSGEEQVLVGTSSEGLLRMNDETAMAGGKVFRPGGGNEPPLTDKGTVLRQVERNARTRTNGRSVAYLQNKSAHTAAFEKEANKRPFGSY